MSMIRDVGAAATMTGRHSGIFRLFCNGLTLLGFVEPHPLHNWDDFLLRCNFQVLLWTMEKSAWPTPPLLTIIPVFNLLLTTET